MKVKIWMGLLLAAAALAVRAETYNGVSYTTSGDIVPGELTSQFSKAKSYADAKNIPLVVVWANPGCSFCASFERNVLAKEKVISWMAARKYVVVFCLGLTTSDGSSAWSYTRTTAYPMCRVHWKKNKAGKAVNLTFCGRTSNMKSAVSGLSGTQGDVFMSLVDSQVGDYAVASAGGTSEGDGGEGGDGETEPRASGKYAVTATCDKAVGSVFGQGDYAEGKKVTLRVTVKKGNEFIGWYDGDTLLSEAKSYSFTMPGEDVDITPRFRTAAEILNAIGLTLDGTVAAPETAVKRTVTQGVPVSWTVAVDGASDAKVAVSGLPSGLKYNSKTGVIAGAATVAKTTTAKVRVTAASGAVKTYGLTVTVEALPSWAKGSFYGACTYGESVGRAVITVASSGKVSGKFIVSGKTYALKASSLEAKEGKTLRVAATVSLKTVSSVRFTLAAEGSLGSISTDDDAELGLNLLQSVWERKDLKAPVFPSGAQMLVVALDGGAVLKFGVKGAVKVGGNVNHLPVSGSSQLVAGYSGGALTTYAQTVLSLSGRAFTGGYLGRVVDLRLKDSNRDGKIDVIVEE